jgi:hypothetical protein
MTQNLTQPEIKYDKKETDSARLDPKQPETRDYLISDDLKPDLDLNDLKLEMT